MDIFRDENVPIETEITRKVTEYDQINGRMTVNFRGQELTMQQIARFLEDPDRPTRQEAWEASSRRRLVDREPIDTIFETLLPMRQKIAQNAGLSDFRAYQWKANKRFDYTPDDCLRFADSIAQTCVPMVRQLDRQRAADLTSPNHPAMGFGRRSPGPAGAAAVRSNPDRSFREQDAGNFQSPFARTGVGFRSAPPTWQSRSGEPQGQAARRISHAAGGITPAVHLHERRRHAARRGNPAARRRPRVPSPGRGATRTWSSCASAPMEFCEVASMSMELLGSEHLGVFYNDADAARAKRKLIEGIIHFFPWMAIDRFLPALDLHASRPQP